MSEGPEPSFTTTYRRADGDLIQGDYGWVAHIEFFEDLDAPVDIVKETWERTSVETITLKPAWWVADPCDNCGESIAEHPDDEAAECWIEAVNAAPLPVHDKETT